MVECFLVDADGEGSRLAESKDDGSLACDLDCTNGLFDFLARVGRGKLLKVLLRGMPPMGSSGRQM